MSHRLFIGIRPPIPVREALIDTMEALEGARWQDDEQRTKIERACDLTGLGRETRRFTPHITIARLNRHTGPIAHWLTRHASLCATWRANGFTLFESHLRASGAHYEAAAHYPLQG